jgi:tripartite-type tricarboxylate transporter receptor subunit TctC
MAKIGTVHVPYRGGGQLITDLISGKVDFSVATAATVLPQIEAGKLRALAVPLPQRSQLLPDTPTIAEAGPLPGYEVANWYALMGPRALSTAIVTRVNEAMLAALKDPEVVAHLARHGLEASPSSAAELAGFMRAETAKWTPIVRASGASND